MVTDGKDKPRPPVPNVNRLGQEEDEMVVDVEKEGG